MKLLLNNKDFQKNFIKPVISISKDEKTAILTEGNKIFSIIRSDNVYLYATYQPNQIDDSVERFNLNLSQLKKGLECIGKEKEFIELDVQKDRRQLMYADDKLKFTVKLIEDSALEQVYINMKTMETWNPGIRFTLSETALSELKKAKNFAKSLKFYIQQNDGNVYFYIGDKLADHEDDIRVFITSEYTGNIQEFIYPIDVLDLLFENKGDIEVKITDDRGALIFQVNESSSILRYLVIPTKK
jgi:hypothetical protein